MSFKQENKGFQSPHTAGFCFHFIGQNYTTSRSKGSFLDPKEFEVGLSLPWTKMGAVGKEEERIYN